MKNITDIYESSLLGDLDDTLDYGDKYADAYNFINWWIESSVDVDDGTLNPNCDKKDVIKRLLNVVSYKNGEFTIDIRVANRDDMLFDLFEYTSIYLSKNIGIPSFIKTINFINVGNDSCMELHSQINDMSKLKITCTGKGNVGLNVKIQTNVTGKVTFPVINTISTLVVARTIDSITFPKGTKIENLELSYCLKLTELNGDLNNVINFTVPKSFAAKIIKASLHLPQKSKVLVA